ncbi:hypothetical protein [Halosimplex pelagicum]|uniref:Uncharacterized protein n=1 Tax=Halosimplex pelagicum TaxID=869886 RepID=A0A7D5TBT5_9EURY|nr:hypothetical protein [Halosimplex pelagicum]QLH82349.1 hypothetical protein HZS54_12305 [Halosimplex pelagicum]
MTDSENAPIKRDKITRSIRYIVHFPDGEFAGPYRANNGKHAVRQALNDDEVQHDSEYEGSVEVRESSTMTKHTVGGSNE